MNEAFTAQARLRESMYSAKDDVKLKELGTGSKLSTSVIAVEAKRPDSTNMTDWLQQYSVSLAARDVVEQAHKKYIDAYTRLADKTASERRDRATESQEKPSSAVATPIKGKASGKDGTADITALRADLISSQKARASLATSLKDVEIQLAQLQAERKQSSSQIAILTKTKLDTERKLRDREEELRGKASLVERAQDEMVALELQMSMAEDRAEKLSKENKDLIDRWMKRMGEEAEKVNRDSKWQ